MYPTLFIIYLPTFHTRIVPRIFILRLALHYTRFPIPFLSFSFPNCPYTTCLRIRSSHCIGLFRNSVCLPRIDIPPSNKILSQILSPPPPPRTLRFNPPTLTFPFLHPTYHPPTRIANQSMLLRTLNFATPRLLSSIEQSIACFFPTNYHRVITNPTSIYLLFNIKSEL